MGSTGANRNTISRVTATGQTVQIPREAVERELEAANTRIEAELNMTQPNPRVLGLLREHANSIQQELQSSASTIPQSGRDAKRIAAAAKFERTTPTNRYGVWVAETPLGRATIRENSNYIQGRSTWRYSVEAYGLAYGTGSPEYVKTLAEAKKRARQLLVDKSGLNG